LIPNERVQLLLTNVFTILLNQLLHNIATLIK